MGAVVMMSNSITLLFSLLCLCLLAASSSGESRSSKKGLVIPYWPRHFCHDFDHFTTIGWWYNYLPVPDPEYNNKWWCMCEGHRPQGQERDLCFPSDPAVQFVPMIRDGVRVTEDSETQQGITIPREFQTILGYNEPNMGDQANTSPLEAALAWMEIQEKYEERELVSPATAHADTDWMDEFMFECEALGCRIDYIATHFYKADSAQNTINVLRDYSERYGKKIWFTEFAVSREHDEDVIINYIEELLPLLEHSDFIYKYSWFVSRYYENYDDSGWFWLDPVNSLLQLNSSALTRVGEAYNRPYHLQMYKPTL